MKKEKSLSEKAHGGAFLPKIIHQNYYFQEDVKQAVQKLKEEIEMVDFKVFLTEIVDKETGEKIEIPDELYKFMMDWWKTILEDLEIRINKIFGDKFIGEKSK